MRVNKKFRLQLHYSPLFLQILCADLDHHQFNHKQFFFKTVSSSLLLEKVVRWRVMYLWLVDSPREGWTNMEMNSHILTFPKSMRKSCFTKHYNVNRDPTETLTQAFGHPQECSGLCRYNFNIAFHVPIECRMQYNLPSFINC